MTITLPAELVEPLGWIGLEWPQADEDQLAAHGQAWIAYGARMRAHAAEANTAAQRVWLANEAASVEAFERWWNAEDGPGRNLTNAVTGAELIGAALLGMAAVTVALKTAFIAQLVALAIAVAQAVAAAVATAGAAAAQIPLWVALVRTACRKLISLAVEQIQIHIGRVLQQAAERLRKAGAEKLADATVDLGRRTSFKGIMRLVERGDVRSPVDGAHFYSGSAPDGRAMKDIAHSYADGVDSVTLNMTRGGKQLEDVLADQPVNRQQSWELWRRLSERYAESTQGRATAWTHDPHPRSIWTTVERPALEANPNVTDITIKSP